MLDLHTLSWRGLEGLPYSGTVWLPRWCIGNDLVDLSGCELTAYHPGWMWTGTRPPSPAHSIIVPGNTLHVCVADWLRVYSIASPGRSGALAHFVVFIGIALLGSWSSNRLPYTNRKEPLFKLPFVRVLYVCSSTPNCRHILLHLLCLVSTLTNACPRPPFHRFG